MTEPHALTESEIESLSRANASFFIRDLNHVLEGKTAIITGCSSGIGASTVKTFLSAGANVVGCYHRGSDSKIYKANAIDDVLDFAEAHYPRKFEAYDLDIADEKTPKILVESAMDSYGGITTLCNFAGIAQFFDFENMKIEDYRRTMDVNLNGHVFLTKGAVGQMRKNPPILGSRGSIVNMSSVAGGIIGKDGVLPYGITKGALRAFTLELAIEVGKYGIRANSIAPGSIVTPINYRDLGDKARKEGIEYRTPLGRWGHAQEIANAALFLASDLSSFITGAMIPIDGGLVSTFRL